MSELSREDWERMIYQANLGREDTIIATKYLLDGIPQNDVAAELGDLYGCNYSRATIGRRAAKALAKIEKMARRYGLV